MNDEAQATVKAYFAALAAKDVSRVAWSENATLRTPLNPNGGETTLIRGRKGILDFFADILPAIRGVKFVRYYTGEKGWAAGQAVTGRRFTSWMLSASSRGKSSSSRTITIHAPQAE